MLHVSQANLETSLQILGFGAQPNVIQRARMAISLIMTIACDAVVWPDVCRRRLAALKSNLVIRIRVSGSILRRSTM